VACGGGLKGDRIAQTIQDDVITLGGTSLKSVACPAQITPQKDATFECTGELTTGYTFTIKVTQRDGQGNVVWDVPNTPGLLNVAKIEALIQDSLKAELGDRPIVDCDGTYKPIQPGQRFDCKLQYAAKATGAASKAGKGATEKIAVIIDSQGSIGWQHVFKDSGRQTGAKASATTLGSAVTSPPSAAEPTGPATAPDPATLPAASPAIAPSPRPTQRAATANRTTADSPPGASSEPTYQDTLKWED
jgi:hypothetical protein